MDGFGFVIMKIIINNDTIRMVAGGQERSDVVGAAPGACRSKKRGMTKRILFCPERTAFAQLTLQGEKMPPAQAPKIGSLACSAVGLWKPDTVRGSVTE
jgi:hypothetical protein